MDNQRRARGFSDYYFIESFGSDAFEDAGVNVGV